MQPKYSLRQHRPGDMGWRRTAAWRVVLEEYGWDERFVIEKAPHQLFGEGLIGQTWQLRLR
jgi:hypothetical protein